MPFMAKEGGKNLFPGSLNVPVHIFLSIDCFHQFWVWFFSMYSPSLWMTLVCRLLCQVLTFCSCSYLPGFWALITVLRWPRSLIQPVRVLFAEYFDRRLFLTLPFASCVELPVCLPPVNEAPFAFASFTCPLTCHRKIHSIQSVQIFFQGTLNKNNSSFHRNVT